MREARKTMKNTRGEREGGRQPPFAISAIRQILNSNNYLTSR